MAKIHKSASIRIDCACPATAVRPADSRTILESHTAAILAQARAEADNLLEAARSEARQIRETAWHEGYGSGQRTAAQEQAILEQTLRTVVDDQIDRLQGQYSAMFDDLHDDLLELSLQIAEKILSLELSRNDSAFLSLVDDAMSRFKQNEKLTVKVSKNDYWRSMVSSAYASAGQGSEITLLADENLDDGSCIIESAAGIVDASLPVQLGKIREMLVQTSLEVGA